MPTDGRECSEDAIRQELERLSAGAALAGSPQLRAMLDYLVTETLAGRSDRIKAYNIAVDVFGRDSSFDPSTDTIVRVQAGRLRAALNRHYGNEVEPSPVRIELPKGSYVPSFVSGRVGVTPGSISSDAEVLSWMQKAARVLARIAISGREQLKAVDWRSGKFLAVALAAVVAAAVLTWNRSAQRLPGETNVVAPTLRQLSVDTLVLGPIHSLSDTRSDQSFARALTVEFATDLTRIGLVNVRQLNKDIDLASDEILEVARLQNLRWGLTGVLHPSEGQRRVNIHLVDLRNGGMIWSQDYTAEILSTPERLSDLIMLDLRPQLYMAVKHDSEVKAKPSEFELFVLATWFPGAEVNSRAWQLERLSLARRAISADPGSGRAYSVLADKLTLLANLDPEFDTLENWKEAEDAARRARVLAPLSADVAFNLALYHLHAGELNEAHRAVHRTLELAPRHTLARIWQLAVPFNCTAPPQTVIDELVRFDADLAKSNPARWQTQVWLARLLLNMGRYREAVEAAQRSMQIIPNLGAAIILVAAHVELGDLASARKVYEGQKAYWKTFNFNHYNRGALRRMCSTSPHFDKVMQLHNAAASAVGEALQ